MIFPIISHYQGQELVVENFSTIYYQFVRTLIMSTVRKMAGPYTILNPDLDLMMGGISKSLNRQPKPIENSKHDHFVNFS